MASRGTVRVDMGSHPINLALRFVLELSALAAVGAFGWLRFQGPGRIVAVMGLPLLFMVLWGVFAVPDDPSRSGSAPVPVPGAVRLALELALFGSAAFALSRVGHPTLAIVLGTTVVLHYLASWDRIRWLLER